MSLEMRGRRAEGGLGQTTAVSTALQEAWVKTVAVSL